MVATLVRLKLTLLRAMFRRSPAQTIGLVFGLLYFGGIVVALAVATAASRAASDVARVAIPLVGSVLTLTWLVVPVFVFGTDPTMDPRRFAVYGIEPRRLAVGLVVAGLLGLPAIGTSLLAIGTVVAWSHSLVLTVFALACAAVGVLTCVTLSRVVVTTVAAWLATRRGRDVMAVAGFVLVMAVSLGMQFLPRLMRDSVGSSAQVDSLVEAAAWTPLGWAWGAPAAAYDGRWAVAVARLVLACALLGALAWLWERAVRREVANPHAVTQQSRQHALGDLGLLARVPDSPTGAVAARVSTYWQRDPRFQIGVLATPVAPLMLLVVWKANDAAWAPLLMAPMLGFLLGWSEHNSVSYEGSAFWTHVATPLSGRADRLGRLLPSAVLGLVFVPLYSVLGTALAGPWRLLPAVLGLGTCALLAGWGLSSVFSMLMAYPVPRPGDSPFATPPGAVGASLLGQLLSSTAMVTLVAPVGYLAYRAWDGAGWAVWATAVAGPVWGATVLAVGIVLGARLYARRSPELLGELSR